MKQISKRLTYANVMSSIAVFLVLGGGAAFAAKQLGKNTVGTKQLKKNAVTTAKIKKNAVTTAKIKKNAIVGAKIKNGAISGAKINLGTLGTVPSADHANSADSASSWGRYFTTGLTKLSVGNSAVVATIGPFTIRTTCTDKGGGEFSAHTYISTSQAKAFINTAGGTSYYEADFEPGIETEIGEGSESTGPYWYDYYDDDETGWNAASPDGSLVLGGNTTDGVHVFGADCAFVTSWTQRS